MNVFNLYNNCLNKKIFVFLYDIKDSILNKNSYFKLLKLKENFFFKGSFFIAAKFVLIIKFKNFIKYFLDDLDLFLYLIFFNKIYFLKNIFFFIKKLNINFFSCFNFFFYFYFFKIILFFFFRRVRNE